MADVILKDGTGNETTFSNIRHVKIPKSATTFATYMQTTQLACYYASYEEDANGKYKYTIKYMWLAGGGAGYCYGTVTDKYCKEIGTLLDNGTYNVALIFTHKTLTIGQTYYDYELGGVD